MSDFEWIALQGLLPQMIGPLLVTVLIMRAFLYQAVPPELASQRRIDRRELRPRDRRNGGPTFASDVDRRLGDRRQTP